MCKTHHDEGLPCTVNHSAPALPLVAHQLLKLE
jgi:hypothetical protein